MRNQVVEPRLDAAGYLWPSYSDCLQHKRENEDCHMEREYYVSIWEAGDIVLETKRMGIDIKGLAEVRWLQSGKILCNDHTLIYSGHKEDHKHGVGLLLSKVVSKSVLGYCALSDRILLVRDSRQAI